MTSETRFDELVSSWLEESAPPRLPERVLEVTFDRTRRSSQQVGWRALLGRVQINRFAVAFGTVAAVIVMVVAGAIGLNFFLNQTPVIGPSVTATPTTSTQPTPTAAPTAAVPSVTPPASIEPTPTPVKPETTPIQPRSGDVPLGWSSDGTRLLIQRAGENLFVVYADGTETQVTDQLSGLTDLSGSARPSGATISPDGSRVVFAGLTTPRAEWRSCHDGGLFAVDIAGGQAELIWQSQIEQNGIVRDPTFSPNGTQIAFVDGYCDSSHNVWVMNADGTDAHKIVPSDIDPLGGTHVHDLAWSAAGDRLAIVLDQGFYEFATDGSDFTPGTDFSAFCWSGTKC